MQPLIFQHLGTVERIRILEDNASKILESHEYEYVLSAEEIQEEEHDHAQKSIEIARLEEEKKELLKELNEDLKKKKEFAASILEKVRSGRDRVVERCFVLEDEATGNLGTYNCHGQLISETPARIGQQRSIKFVNGGDGSKENPYVAKVG